MFHDKQADVPLCWLMYHLVASPVGHALAGARPAQFCVPEFSFLWPPVKKLTEKVGPRATLQFREDLTDDVHLGSRYKSEVDPGENHSPMFLVSRRSISLQYRFIAIFPKKTLQFSALLNKLKLLKSDFTTKVFKKRSYYIKSKWKRSLGICFLGYYCSMESTSQA